MNLCDHLVVPMSFFVILMLIWLLLIVADGTGWGWSAFVQWRRRRRWLKMFNEANPTED